MAKIYEDICICVDPGFDSVKVVVNGEMLKFPFNVEQAVEEDITSFPIEDNLYLYRDKSKDSWTIYQKFHN